MKVVLYVIVIVSLVVMFALGLVGLTGLTTSKGVAIYSRSSYDPSLSDLPSQPYMVVVVDGPRWPYVAGSIVMVILPLVALYSALVGRRRLHVIRVENDRGAVAVAVRAIEDFVDDLVRGRPDVNDVASRVRKDRGGIQIDVKVWLAGMNVFPTTASIQELIVGRVREMFGLEQIRQVNVSVVKAQYREEAPAAAPTPASQPPAVAEEPMDITLTPPGPETAETALGAAVPPLEGPSVTEELTHEAGAEVRTEGVFGEKEPAEEAPPEDTTGEEEEKKPDEPGSGHSF